MDKKACIICDIDRVVVDSREWEKYIPEDNRDREGWKNFLKFHNLAKPNKLMINFVVLLSRVFPILFVTSRENYSSSRAIAKNQIRDFSNGKLIVGPLSQHKLFMREFNDFREAHEVKEDILVNKILPLYEPLLAIDDNKDNIGMFKKHGIRTFHYKGLLE